MRQQQVAPSSFGKQREREKASRGMVMATQNTPRLWRSSARMLPYGIPGCLA